MQANRPFYHGIHCSHHKVILPMPLWIDAQPYPLSLYTALLFYLSMNSELIAVKVKNVSDPPASHCLRPTRRSRFAIVRVSPPTTTNAAAASYLSDRSDRVVVRILHSIETGQGIDRLPAQYLLKVAQNAGSGSLFLTAQNPPSLTLLHL